MVVGPGRDSFFESGILLGSMPEDEFAELVQGEADDSPPRVFALVEEHGERADCSLFAWGLEFEERASVFDLDGVLFARCSSADGAHELFSRIRKIRLVWPATSLPDPAG
ncbi:hypothetical protein MOQ72_30170 [Saccharopolyspora sp. K220]|uniref:hypothetical protein n=1 Tax=Saccharopolyspora soli TaxID=2926618 RepID=UPI001F55FD40|nr:hypothetical protein [Saccharopolyspora soli]MCI2421710.1 hypothetical protein [Saccharopolyspora soli]